MALYKFKDFLTFDDVASYLADKGVYKFDLSYKKDVCELTELLIGFIHDFRLSPVVRYNGLVLKNYYHVEKTEYEHSYFLTKRIQRDFCSYFIIYRKKSIELLSSNKDVNLKDTKLCGYFDSKDEEDFEIKEDLIINKNNLLYPISQLDDIFNQKSKETSQTFDEFGIPSITILQPGIETLNQRIKERDDEIATLKTRIAELEKIVEQSNDEKLTAYSQKTVAKLLYALLKEHKYELGAKKGTTNDILESLTAKHGVGISRETISKWLDRVNALENKTF